MLTTQKQGGRVAGPQLPPGLKLTFVQLSHRDQANGKMKAEAVITGTLLQELGLLCGLGEGMSWQWCLILVHLTSSLPPAEPFSDGAPGDLQGGQRSLVALGQLAQLHLAACLGSLTTVPWE